MGPDLFRKWVWIFHQKMGPDFFARNGSIFSAENGSPHSYPQLRGLWYKVSQRTSSWRVLSWSVFSQRVLQENIVVLSPEMGPHFIARNWVFIFHQKMGPGFFTRQWVLNFSLENGSPHSYPQLQGVM